MNHVTIIGRLTKDPEIRYSAGAQPVAFGNYTLAADRPVGKDKEKVTDFLMCKVVGKTAEFAEKYLKKGMKIAIEGRVQCDVYKDKDGNSRSSTYIQVQQHEFCESRGDVNASAPAPAAQTDQDGFFTADDGELPFL